MTKWNKTDSFNEVRPVNYSYPMNTEFPNSIASTGVQTIALLAYASGSNIIVLMNGDRLIDVITGHPGRICTIAFEKQGSNLISCDILGNFFFWQYQENSWQKTWEITLSKPATCISIFPTRRIIAFTNKKGLFTSSINEFGTNHTQLLKTASFCEFDISGSLLASHNYTNFVTIFEFRPNKNTISYVLKHHSNIISFSFHPTENMCLTVCTDGILRIWKQNQIFSCTSMIKINSQCAFVNMPHFIAEPSRSAYSKKMHEIGIINNSNMLIMELNDNGKIPNDKFPINQQIIQSEKLIGIYKTSLGKLAFLVSKNYIKTISTDNTQYYFYFHQEKIIQHKFISSKLLTRDEHGVIMTWLGSSSKVSNLIAKNAGPAEWINDNTVSYFKNNKIYEYNIENKEEKEKDYFQQIFSSNNILENNNSENKNNSINNNEVLDLIHVNNEYYLVFQDKIVTKDKIYPFEFQHFAFSNEYQNFRVLFFAEKIPDEKRDNSRSYTFFKNQRANIRCFIIPGFIEIDVEKRVFLENTENSPILSIKAGGICSFVVQTQNTLEFWNYTDSQYTLTKVLNNIPHFNGLHYDLCHSCSRVLAYTNKALVAFYNDAEQIYTKDGITGVDVDEYGNVVVFTNQSFSFFPTFCFTANTETVQIEKHTLSLHDTPKFVKAAQKEKAYSLHLNDDSSLGYMLSPADYIPINPHILKITQLTLIHLLEFKASYELTNCDPQQVPAFPNQQVIPNSLELPENALPEYQKLLEMTNDIHHENEDIDMFGVRFLLGCRSSPIPPEFFGLYFSFSATQSQIVDSLKKTITIFDLSKMFIPACLKSQQILEDLVITACSNTWKQSQNVELVALYYVALGNISKVVKLYSLKQESQKSEFFKKDFSTDRNKKSAVKNAYSSLSKHTYDMASTLFLLAGDVQSAISTMTDKMQDPLLALLILRLKFKDMNHPTVQKFLKNVQWPSDLIPCMLSNLMGQENTANLLENALYKERTNLLQFGDWRIHIFEILFSITRSKTHLYKLMYDLLSDSLAPLALYLYKYCQFEFETVRAVENVKNNQTENEEDDKPVRNMFSSSSSQSEDDDMNFDFGGHTGFDDNWDDDEYYSDDDDEEESQQCNVNNSQASTKDAENNSQNDTNTSNDQINNRNESVLEENNKLTSIYDKIFHEYQLEVVISLCSLLVDTSDNEKGGLDAVHFASFEKGFKSLSEKKQNETIQLISYFIDYCCSRFLSTSPMPVGAHRLFFLSESLYKMICYRDPLSPKPFLVSGKYFDEIEAPEIRSVYLGLFVVAIWTFDHSLLANLLSNGDAVEIKKDPSEFTETYVNTDITSPLFADSLPNLLNKYCATTPDAPIDLHRRIIIWLIFANGVQHCPQLDSRFTMLTKALQYYQAAVGAPSIAVPILQPTDKLSNLAKVILQTHEAQNNRIQAMQREAFRQTNASGVFRNGKLCTTEQSQLPTLPGKVLNIQRSNLDPSSVVIHTTEHLFYVIINNKTSIHEITGASQDDIEDISRIVSHPFFDLFIGISPHSAKIFDASQVADNHFVFSNHSPINCASISPLGSKVAFGTTSVDIINLNIATDEHKPSFTKHYNSPVKAICWVNAETQLVIAVDHGLRVLSTLTQEDFKLSYPLDWGDVTAMATNRNRNTFVFGTESGKLAVADIKLNFNFVCVFDMAGPITDISVLGDVFAVCSESGAVTLFSAVSPMKHETIQLPLPVRSISIGSNWLLAAIEDSSEVLIWKL